MKSDPVEPIKRDGDDNGPEKVREQGLVMWTTVRDAVNKDGISISSPFMRKVSKRDYPDYYELIKQPIALEDIKKKLDHHEYPSLQTVRNDFELLFANAKQYNQTESAIFQDAKELWKLVQKTYSRLVPNDDENEKKPPSLNRLMRSRLEKLIAKKDPSGRPLCTEFMALPSKKEWPIYYKEIQKPQCLDAIQKHIKRKEYYSSAQFADDVELVFSNALTFNQDHTPIWNDAVTLRDYFRRLMSDMPAPYSLPDYAKYAQNKPSNKIKIKPPQQTQPTATMVQQTQKQEQAPASLFLRVPAAHGTSSAKVVTQTPLHTTHVSTPQPQMKASTEIEAPVPTPKQPKHQSKPPPPPSQPQPQQQQQPIAPIPQPPAQTVSFINATPSHYPRAPYVPTPPIHTPNPVMPSAPPSMVQTNSVPAYSTSQSPAPAVLPLSHQLQSISLRIQPRGRHLTLDHRDGVKSWVVRLVPGESSIILSNITFLGDNEDEASSAEEDEAEKDEEYDMDVDAEPGSASPSKNGRKKGKGRGRGRPPKASTLASKAAAIKVTKTAKKKPTSKVGEIQLKLNNFIQTLSNRMTPTAIGLVTERSEDTTSKIVKVSRNNDIMHEDVDAEGEDDGEEDATAEGGVMQVGEGKKKKKKKKSKKKKPEQSDPPRIGLTKLFPTGIYPEGELQEYKNDNSYRITSEEKRHAEKLANEDPETTYNDIRRAAEVHRQVRQSARKFIRPGMAMTDIANYIEDGTRALVEENGFESGVGFPTGLSLNHCAAHYTPNAGDTTILQQGDVLKVDFGVHVNGRIVDSAFTLTFDHTYDKLVEAVKAATETGVREAGIDVRLGELAGYIQETMESYEVEVGSKVYPVKPIANLSGHSINKYQIHGGKSVMLVKNDDETKMEEGEYFAIETFGSTGRGRIVEGGECSHYAKKVDAPHVPLRLTTAKSLLKSINKNFGTLPFCRRYLDRAGESKYLLALNHLVQQGIVQDYPPLCDQRGSMTAQFEHTILLRPTRKEIVSRGDDY
ncbi:hypothetical protein HYPSUDRAFT_128999 [Hypholoma sublateritium FD-334 SS-4]|uniref:Methionine aminopeptidase 2 n=1 Tax=Hypholoma sublateritium (strain FD-334 SS-4) TaxID=945553 RepID=A0A0D2QA52_HYPSF|nr:hypothetical protein HYPSUDRAFT_128999 [Hypholoma sublateritium FD-334 SS-4]